jgi:hypothetical protein
MILGSDQSHLACLVSNGTISACDGAPRVIVFSAVLARLLLLARGKTKVVPRDPY